jgi:hypothetical protein
MKIQKKYIGAKVWHPILNQYIDIEVGNEEKYLKLGLDIFVKARKPKLQKKSNDQDSEKRNINNDNDVEGTDNNQ